MLRRGVEGPLAIGEEFASKWQALSFVERGLTQYMRLDICNRCAQTFRAWNPPRLTRRDGSVTHW